MIKFPNTRVAFCLSYFLSTNTIISERFISWAQVNIASGITRKSINSLKSLHKEYCKAENCILIICLYCKSMYYTLTFVGCPPHSSPSFNTWLHQASPPPTVRFDEFMYRHIKLWRNFAFIDIHFSGKYGFHWHDNNPLQRVQLAAWDA